VIVGKAEWIMVVVIHYSIWWLSLERLLKICQNRHKWLLEAKIGKYKLYDLSILSLGRRNTWVSDEVCAY